MNRFAILALATSAAIALSAPATAAVVTLDFTGVATPSNQTTVGGYYNGGTSGDGNSGVNYGVAFSSNALAINSYNGGDEPNPGILFFLSGGAVTIDYAAGFDTGFSFFYASNSNASVTVWDALGGTGNMLATINLANNFNSGCGGYCVWDPIGVNFAGTAKSINFAGGADFVGYDQITFGAATPGGTGAVPEPGTWAMMLVGFGMTGAALRYRRRRVAVTYA